MDSQNEPNKQKETVQESIAELLHPDTITYNQAIRGTDRVQWLKAAEEELERLLTGTKTIEFIHQRDKPKDRLASYYNPQCKVKIKEGKTTYRVRGTYGGDRSDYTGPTTADTAAMTTTKLLLNATVSENAEWMTLDIVDFYLNTVLDRKEYMRISRKHLPAAFIKRHNLEHLFFNDNIMTRIHKGIYGLKQAGKLAQDRLFAHLEKHGYTQCKHTTCLFRHDTRDIKFALVVDDFGVKYKSKDDADHLIGVLQLLYEIKINWKGDKYLGWAIKYDRTAHTLSISMPHYVARALKSLGIEKTARNTDSPSIYQKPVYGHRVQTVTEDTSAPIDATRAKTLQRIVGIFLYYARAVDNLMARDINHIGSAQAKPTEAVWAKAMRFLQYAATWPDSEIVYHASDMILRIHSDASYHSESSARSRAGGIHYLGNKTEIDTEIVNGAVDIISIILSSVVSGAAEAEYGALFTNAQTAIGTRNTLDDLGYPQGKTPIIADNTTAVGIANRTVKQKKLKCFDMRYHWIRDRCEQGQFDVIWKRGKDNLADIFTKAHPVHHFRSMRKLYVYNPSIQGRKAY
jgi:hypothetical protein